MSYQIKSTPFFRRMLSTSKKNGQLQRLKEEYERMKEFNDRAIEMKMRQVRLKRLFKEIEEIKETTTQQPKRRRTLERAKTIDEIRLETLIKAKELGKEYSKMNALLVGSGSKIDNYATSSKSASRIESRKKKLMEKAVNYGNDSSRANMEKLKQTPRKKNSLRNEPKSMSAINESQEKLKQRLSYGNSRSSINMTRVPNKRQVKTTLLSSGIFKPTENTEMSHKYEISANDMGYLPSTSDLLNCSYDELQRSMMQLTKHVEELCDEPPANKRASEYWRKIALTVKNRFDRPMRRNSPKIRPVHSDDYRLRNVDNDTDLTLQDSQSDKHIIDRLATDGFEEHIPNEVLLSVNPLTDSASWTTAKKASKTSARTYEIEVLKEPKIASKRSQNLMLKKTVIPTEKVHKLAKIFEPFVREAAQKEVFDGVRKLKHIFEHQTNTE